MRVSSLILAALVALSLTGCAVTPSVRVHPLTAGQPTIVDLDASARAIIMVPKADGKGMAVCSEPSPDVAMSAVASMLAQVKLDNPNVDVQPASLCVFPLLRSIAQKHIHIRRQGAFQFVTLADCVHPCGNAHDAMSECLQQLDRLRPCCRISREGIVIINRNCQRVFHFAQSNIATTATR